MPTIAKKTSDILFDTWTTIQHRVTGAELDDSQPLDNDSGNVLVFERSIWKYPEQGAGGSVTIPGNAGRPARLIAVLADLGAASDWELHVASTANTSDTPYPSGDAALYDEGDIIVASDTAQQYLALNLSIIIHPTQRVYMETTGANDPVIRFVFSKAFDHKNN